MTCQQHVAAAYNDGVSASTEPSDVSAPCASSEEPEWLSEDEACMWRAFLRMRRALDRGVDRHLTECSGLSIADYQLLVPLSEAPGMRLRARDLGREVDWERSRLSHQIRRMEQRGLLERLECPTDARGTIIALTAAGAEAIRGAAPSHVTWVREHFIDLLTEEERLTLQAVAERVLARFAAEECSGSDGVDEGEAEECPGTGVLADDCDT